MKLSLAACQLTNIDAELDSLSSLRYKDTVSRVQCEACSYACLDCAMYVHCCYKVSLFWLQTSMVLLLDIILFLCHVSRFLDLSFNKLRTLPSCISTLVGVERLNLGFNPLTTCPDVLTALTNLKELNIDFTGKQVAAGHLLYCIPHEHIT